MTPGKYPEASENAMAAAAALIREHGLAAWLAACEHSDEAIGAGDLDGQRFWDSVLGIINAWEGAGGQA